MVFGSLFFLTVFLPPALLGHWALQALARRFPRAGTAAANLWLLGASTAACFLADLRGLPWLLGCAVATDLLARGIAAAGPRRPRLRKALLALAVGGNLALLCAFKYAGVLAQWAGALAGSALVPAPELTMPLGASFWIFRAISYAWDVERGACPPARNPLDFLCYMALFPILVSGPIVRWADVAGAFRFRPFSAALAASGFRRLFVGLAKKILVANQLAPFADAVWGFADAGRGMSPGMAALGVAAYSLQLYFDFSGYSDMAIGLGRTLGFDFGENFLWPYASASIREFWRRWHVSLSTWFRDYVYIPLGGSRRGAARTCLNVLAVFALCGAWHGAGRMFVLWGLWHGALVGGEFLLARGRAKGGPPPRRPAAIWALRLVAGHAYALAGIAVGWVLFRSGTPAAAGVVLGSLAGLVGPSPAARALAIDLSPFVRLVIAAGAVLCLPVVPALRSAARRVLPEGAAWALESVAATAVGAAALLLLASGTHRSFLYSRF